jgi:outer membrane protein assembly factor BamB
MKRQTTRLSTVYLTACLVTLSATCLFAGDWPQWRYDAGRGAASPHGLPEELHLQWVRQLPKPSPAWPASQPWLRFDLSYSPVAAGRRLVVPSMVTDSVTAYDTQTGQQQWRFYADGPVRLAPIAHGGKVYFGADDGYLYCLDAANGTLLWRVRGGPSQRKVLGNQRLISTWPVRGGPVLHRGKVYFTAGIWPFMGVFVHAVDAETGNVVWTNSGQASTYSVQPHSSPAFAGFVPRGHLVATDHGLIAPGGRTQPGCYDLETGEFRYFTFGGKGSGSYHVTARDQWFFTPDAMARIADGTTIGGVYPQVHDEEALYSLSGGQFVVQNLHTEEKIIEPTGRRGQKGKVRRPALTRLWQMPAADVSGRLFLKAGSRFYLGADDEVSALEAGPDDKAAKVVWRGAVEGRPWTMLAADERLFVVTTEGRVYCFGGKPRRPRTYTESATPQDSLSSAASSPGPDPCKVRAEGILSVTRATEGYCLMLGLGDGRLAEALVRGSKLHLIAVDPDAKKVDAFRRRMDEAGLYGSRVTAQVGDPVDYPWPPYLASLIVTEDLPAACLARRVPFFRTVFRALRPYGGLACLPLDAKQLQGPLKQARLEGARLKPAGKNWSLLVREGALPGAADWTHNYADAAQSVVSRDRRVKAPLGLLWFGGPPNDEVLPRHGHGPAPQVAAGRLLIEGGNMLRALDIYTGRLLWQRQLPGLGKFYDITGHRPGAGEIGSNYVSLEDAVYVVYGNSILELDPTSGETTGEFKPDATGTGQAPHWGHIAAWEDLLIATSTPVSLATLSLIETAKEAVFGESKSKLQPASIKEMLAPVQYSSASRRLVVLNRKTGERLWDREARYGFRHNSIAVGAGKVFCIDALSPAKRQALRRRGKQLGDYQPRLMALDVRTGQEIWSTGEDVFGTFLNYSAEHDVLLQAGSAFRDRAKDEADTGMVAYRGEDGHVIWKDLELKHSGPCLLHHDTIITQGPAYSLLTGQPKVRKHPLTGATLPWRFTRNYGCNTAVASEHLITFRSAAAGYYDLAGDGGTGNFGGFKSSCTSNLIVAGGLLNAPEYTRTCECRYQNQTSLALVHDPEVEVWTFNSFDWGGQPVRRVGVNFGAPGDRLADDGTLWLDYPSRGGPSPDIPVRLEANPAEYFRFHSSRVRADADGGELSWVAASGLRGLREVTLTLARDQARPRNYTVRLHFAEVDRVAPGRRVFDVSLQDHRVLEAFDVVKLAGGRNRALVKEFTGVEVTDKLKVSLAPGSDEPSLPPLLCGIELVAEGW